MLFPASSANRSQSAIAAFRNAVKSSLLLVGALLIAPPAVAANPSAAAPAAAPPPASPLTVDEVPNGEDQAAPAAPPAEPVPEVEGTEVNPTHDDVSERMSRVEQELAVTREMVVPPAVAGEPSAGYIDASFFSAGGNDAGVVQDLGPKSERLFPQYHDHYSWVFLGDLLAPAINSRGEAADLGNLPNTDRFDSVHSGGAPGFIINEVNLTLSVAVADGALATTAGSMDFLPRSRLDFRARRRVRGRIWLSSSGCRPPTRRTSIFVSKDGVGAARIEYREPRGEPALRCHAVDNLALHHGHAARDQGAQQAGSGRSVHRRRRADQRLFHHRDVSTSTTARIVQQRQQDRQRPHISPSRLDSPDWKWGSRKRGAARGDHAQDSRDPLWFAGVDAQAQLGRIDLKAEWLMGRGAGESGLVYTPPHTPYGLRLNGGGYLETDVVLSGRFGFLLRAEYRDALVWLGDPAAAEGAERIYVSKVWRATGGVRFTPSEHVTLKAEYLHNGEYGGIPSIPDDVFTSSLILQF